MTKSKNKVSLLGLVIAFVFMVAGIFMFVPNNIATVSAQDLDKDIHFSLATSNEKLVFAPGAQTVGAVTITYTVVNTNDGINNLVFIPAYNHDVFAIDEITVNADTNLGDATITNGYSSYTGDYVKLAFDSTTLFDAEDVTLVTITYNTKENLTYSNNGSYNFSLVLNYTDLTQTRSTAYYILGDENLGEQEEVEIIVDDVNVELFIQQSGSLNITDATVEYDANPVGISLDGENEVNYSFTGNGTITWTWYSDENYQNEISAPTNAGTYYLKGTMATTDVYVGATVQSAVTVNKLTASVVIDNKTSAYGDAIVELTHQAPTGLIGEDTLVINLSTTATSSSPAGTYSITGTVGTGSNPNYNVTFTDGTYTITARAITIKANDQSAQYTGSEPTVDQTAYTVTGATIESGVVITKQAGVNVGSYTLTPSYTNSNYSITFENGTFYITSVGKDAEYIFGFFSGDTVTYDTNSHDLLVVNNQIPSWIAYQPSNNVQTNANSYTIGISVTLSAQDAANYTNGTTQFNSTVTGKINPYAITVTADNKSHVYGNTPATLTPVEAGLTGDKVTVTFTVYKDYAGENEAAITLSTTTPVGTYTIVPSATSSNYAFTFGNGTYTVTKATPVLSLVALDTEYNDHLYFANASITVGSQVLEINGSSHENDYGFEYRIEIYNANNQKVLNDAWITENYWLDAGVYTAKLVLEGTDNYNGAVYEYISEEDFDTQFTIEKVTVAAPTVEYNGATVTWSVVSKDEDDKDLHNATVTYTIGGTEYANRSFTATAKGTYTLVITPSNTTNYMANEVELEPVYSVTFTEGNHPANTATPTNMPAVQYVFKGQKTTAPATNPSLTGYTFAGWDFDFNDYIIEDMVDDNGNLNIPATWTINQVTMTVVYVHSANNTYVETSKTFNANYNSNVVISESNLIEKAHITDIVSQYNLNGMKYTYNGFWNYKVTGEDVYIRENVTDIVVNATQNYTFVARYNATPIVYDITYYYSFDGAQSTPYTIENAAYGSTINYLHVDSMKWFRVEAWYLDEARTQVAPVTMPAHDITVYGALVFNVGKGDVNGDGNVDTDDITLYRQWIVGGYTMTVLSNNEELYEAAQIETEEPTNTTYYIMRVADINVDLSKDIRDVSITRMSIAGGYKWDIVTGENVTGEEIIRNVYSANIDNIEAALLNGGRATVYADITDTTKEIVIVKPESIYIDLNGHTVYIKSFDVRTTGVNATITVLNGTIKTTDGITIAAPNGNVILQDLEGWVNDNQVNLQAASNSLHIKQNVAFYNYAYEQQESEEPVLTLAPAIVKVEKDTHIVVEQQADLVVEKIVVTEQNFAQEAQDVDAKISVTVNSAETSIIEVAGNCDVANNVAETKVISSNNPNLDLIKAAKNGGEFTLEKDYLITEPIVVENNLTLNLNGHKIYNEEDIWRGSNWSLISVKSGILTINGNGTLDALANDCYAIDVQNGAELVVNGGTYYGNISAIYAHSGNVTVNGGEFHLKQVETDGGNAYRFMLNCLDASYKNGISNFVVNGGKFYGFNPEDNASEGTNTDYLQNAYVKATEESNVPVYEVVSNGVTNEQELRAALTNKARTIRVLNDISSTNGYLVENNTSIDLGGNTITVTSGSNVNSRAFKVDNGATLSVANGTVDAQGTQKTGCYGAFRAEVGTTLNLTNLTLKNYNDFGLSVKVLGANATLDGVNFVCVYGGAIEVTDDEGADGTVRGYAVMRNCSVDQTLVGRYSWISSAVNVSGNSVLDVYSTTYSSDGEAIYVYSSGGTINIYGGTYTGNRNLVVLSNDLNTYPTAMAVVNIYDGEFHGTFSVARHVNSNEVVTEQVNIYGGTFDNDPSAYVADKHYVEANNGVYTVKEYNTISNAQELLAAVANGGYYQVVADFEVNQTVKIEKDFVLDGNNHAITFNKQDNGKYAFNVDDNNTAQIIAEFSNLNIVSTGYQVAILLNGDFNSRLTLNNVDITCDGECVYSNGHATVYATDCDFTHSGIYETGKDDVYYSALIVGYGATINATNCNVESFGNGVATFPSGGYVNLVNTNITVSESASVNENAGYALWARNEDYNNLPAYNTDSVIIVNGGNIVGEFKITDKYTSGDKNLHEPRIEIKGGKFDNDPEAYVAEGYKSVYVEDEQLYWVVDKDAIIGSAGSMIESEEEN